MTARALRCIAAVVLVAAAPAARAFVWQARVGVIYGREDSWEPRQTVPHLDLDLGLNLSGFVYHPNALTYGAGVSYRRSTVDPPDGGESVTDALDYQLRLTLFGSRASVATVNAFAQQHEDTFSTSSSDYSSRSRAYGGDLRLALFGPPLSVGYSRTETVQHVPTLADTERNAHYVTAATGAGGNNFSYNARYSGAFADGTFASENANEHRVNVTGLANVTPRVRVHFADEFYRREATVDSPFNPHQETNSLNFSLTGYTSERETHRMGYSYARGIQLAPDADDIERLGQAIDYSYDRMLENPEWRITGTAGATLAQDRLGTAEATTTGQSLGALVQWRRRREDRTIDVRGGPQVGLVEPDGGDVSVGYGASAGIVYVREAQVATWQLGYDAGYTSSIGDAGWSFRPRAHASAEMPLGVGHLSAQLTASGEQRDSPLYGAGGTRSLSGRAAYSRRGYGASLTLSMTSGLTNAVSASGGRGVFLALPYDSHTYTAALSASAALVRGLTASTQVQANSIVMADRPAREDLTAMAQIAYALGALSLSVDERYTIIRVAGDEFRANVILLMASRSFGSRF